MQRPVAPVSRRSVILGAVAAALVACSERSPGTTPTTTAGTTTTAPRTSTSTSTPASTSTSPAPPVTEVAPLPDTPTADAWDTVAAADVGWSQGAVDELVDIVGATRGQSFVLLHDGRIVAERYWRGADASTVRDVASVQKSITSTLVGIAHGQGLVDLDMPVTEALGAGWSAADADDEATITVRHLLTMTSGLAPRRLTREHPAGEVWAYNTEAYQRLLPVLEAVTGADLDDITRRWLLDPIGAGPDARWYDRPVTDPLGNTYRGLELSARDMARIGLLATRGGTWADTEVVPPGWFAEAWSPIDAKADYGMLWWLLGRGPLRRSGAPADAVAALGKADQKIYAIPSARLVLVRQGDAARGTTLTASRFDRTLMESVAAIISG